MNKLHRGALATCTWYSTSRQWLHTRVLAMYVQANDRRITTRHRPPHAKVVCMQVLKTVRNMVAIHPSREGVFVDAFEDGRFDVFGFSLVSDF